LCSVAFGDNANIKPISDETLTNIYDDNVDSNINNINNTDNTNNADNTNTVDNQYKIQLHDLCNSLIDILCSDSMQSVSLVHKLKDYIDDTLLWLYISPTNCDDMYKLKIIDINNICNELSEQDIFINNNKEQLEMLCLNMKLNIEDGLINDSSFITTIDEILDFVQNTSSISNDDYVLLSTSINDDYILYKNTITCTIIPTNMDTNEDVGTSIYTIIDNNQQQILNNLLNS
jgi:hypothetical protein